MPLLSGVDLTNALGAATTVTSALDGVLGTVGLDGLLDIEVLKITEVVEPDGDYTKAFSSLDVLGVNVAPLVGVLQAGAPAPAPDSAGALVPALLGSTGGGMLELGEVLGGITSLLTDGLGINVGTMQAEGFFTPVAALPPNIVAPPAVTTPDGKLPRTGADTALPALMAVLLVGAALGVRRMVRVERVDS